MKILISEQQLKSIVKNQQKGAILIGGLDDRTDKKTGELIDKTIGEQISLLKSASGFSNIIGLRYSTSDGDINKTILNNPNFPIVLFSAGCQKADVVLNTNGVNPNKVFLIQPWAASKKRMDYYNGLSIPKNQIYVGKFSSTGNGIRGATRCPEGMGHWESLPAIGGMVLKLR
jgi:hypothetical protein